MPYRYNPTTGELDYYEVSSGGSTPANYDAGNASSIYGGSILIDGGTA